MLVRHHDAARTPLVEEPCHGVSRSREPRVDELIAHEEYEDRVSHRGAPPGPQANELDVVKHVERARVRSAFQIQKRVDVFTLVIPAPTMHGETRSALPRRRALRLLHPDVAGP